MISLFKKKEFFSAEEKAKVMSAIHECEALTSGQIIVYTESRNPMMDPLDRAREIFAKLHMHRTEKRNAVLLYLALKDNELALFADEGIYRETAPGFWDEAVKKMIAHFSGDNIVHGIVECVNEVGDALREVFPHAGGNGKNELPDDMVFGK